MGSDLLKARQDRPYVHITQLKSHKDSAQDGWQLWLRDYSRDGCGLHCANEGLLQAKYVIESAT